VPNQNYHKFHLWTTQFESRCLERPGQFDRVLGDLAVVVVHQGLTELESSQLYRFQCQFVALRANPVEDDHSLLDCRGVAASGDAREHGHDAGDLAKLLEPLAAVRYRVY